MILWSEPKPPASYASHVRSFFLDFKSCNGDNRAVPIPPMVILYLVYQPAALLNSRVLGSARMIWVPALFYVAIASGSETVSFGQFP